MARAREEAGDSQLVSGRETSSQTIRVSVKTPQDYQDFLLAENSNVCHFKKQIAKRLHCDPDRLVLIFTGKILRDQDILSQRGILDGSTVHLVVRTRLKGPTCPGTLPGPTGHGTHRSEPPASESAGIPTRLGRLARNLPELVDIFCQLAPLLMMAPESLVQFLEDPLIQGLASEKQANVPEASRQVQRRYPALKTLETFQKPIRQHVLLPEKKRSLDSLNAVPGGDNAMHPVYSDIQQLMFSPLALLVASKGYVSSSDSFRGEANAESNSDTITTTTSIPTTSAPTRPLVQEVSSGGGAHARGLAPNQVSSGYKIGIPDLYPGQDFPSQDSQQHIEKGYLASQQTLSPPVLRRALHVLQQNPSLLHQLATSSPLLHHIPLLPILTNPRALQALIQIEQGLQILSKEVPGLGPFFRDPARPRVARGVPEARARKQGLREDPIQPTLAVLQLLHALANACSQSTQSTVPSFLFTESRYQQELEQLKALGFADHDANLQALIATDGDIHAAIERLLGVPLA